MRICHQAKLDITDNQKLYFISRLHPRRYDSYHQDLRDSPRFAGLHCTNKNYTSKLVHIHYTPIKYAISHLNSCLLTIIHINTVIKARHFFSSRPYMDSWARLNRLRPATGEACMYVACSDNIRWYFSSKSLWLTIFFEEFDLINPKKMNLYKRTH